MATPRKRHFNVADSIYRESWPRDLKLTLVMLSAYLNTRWARDAIPHRAAGRATLSPGSLADITGADTLEAGRESLRELAEKITLWVEADGDFTKVDWPKFAEFQGYGVRQRGRKRDPSPAPSLPLSASASASAPATPPQPPLAGARPEPVGGAAMSRAYREPDRSSPLTPATTRAQERNAADLLALPAATPEQQEHNAEEIAKLRQRVRRMSGAS